MTLGDLYASLSGPERLKLAAKAGANPKYLYQIATRWRGRKPSLALLHRLTQADKRLKLADLVREFA